MKFEKLNESNGKVSRVFLYGLITGVGLLIIFNLFLTKAKYKVVDSAKLVNSTINYTNADLNVIAMYKSNGKTEELIKEVPEGYYDIDNEKSYCKIPDSDNPIKDKITYDGKEVNIKITKKGTKCYVHFIPAAANTLADIGIKEEIKEGKTEFTGIATEADSGLFSGEDDYGTTYYYRGIVNNNWIKFGKTKNDQDIYWRIIRINGDGTIRLIYSGKDEPATTGDDTQIGTSAFNIGYNDNTYVGYYYGEANSDDYYNTHSNKYPSTVASKVEEWFNETTKLSEEYINYIDENAGFCNDRQISTTPKKWWKEEGEANLGTKKVATAYGSFPRILTNENKWRTDKNEPTLKCNQKNKDLFTLKNKATQGNKKLNYPVGLITADEIILAGGFGRQNNTSYWLYTEESYWAMTPSIMGTNGAAYIFNVNTDGSLANYNVGSTRGVRPVINLKANTPFETGDYDGTSDKPFTVKIS